MKIRVKAEETVYLEYFVEVPEHITKDSRFNCSYHWKKKAISDWIDENESEFSYQDYDSVKEWYDWEEVEDND